MKRDPRLVRLSREHTQALMLAQRLRRELPRADAQALPALYADVVRFWAAGLLPHFTAEGECLLARLIRHVPESDPAVGRLQHDHLRIEALVASIRDARGETERREALEAFHRDLAAHVRWEEETLFPLTEQTLEQHELDALGADLEARLPEYPLPAPLGPAAS